MPKESELGTSRMNREKKERAKASENTQKRRRVIFEKRNSFLFESMEAINLTH